MKLGNGGQMRVVESMIACVILIIGLSTTAYFSSIFTTEEGGGLDEIGQNIFHVLDKTDLIKQIIQNEGDWESKLKTLLETLLPPDTFYNLTMVSGLTGQPIAGAITNMEGQVFSSSLDAVSLQRVVTISLPLARIEQMALDVILIIDRSGSMGQSEPGDQHNKIYYAKQAAKTFVDQMNASKDRVGLVSYSDGATLDIGLTNNFQQVKSKIDNLSPNGYTNMGDAVKKLNEEFFAHNRTGATLAMILLTDGVANRPCPHSPQHVEETCPYAREYALNESGKAEDHSILIYTIGLGANARDFDEDLLKEMQTNGYYYAPSAKDLMNIYMAIAQDLLFAVKYEIVVLTLTLVKAG